MLLFIALIGTAVAWRSGDLSQGLQSAEGQVKLFTEWAEQEHMQFSAGEKAARFRIFRGHLKEIVDINAEQEDYETTINFMAGLNEEEQQQFYGINITAHPVDEWDEEAPEQPAGLMAPTAVDWKAQGKVTGVKNQGGCGSCWTFAGIVAFEGQYAVKTGGLKTFSEQEFLDCTYNDGSGCKGGWYWDAYQNTVGKSQHLALSRDYPYNAKDGRCRTTSTKNGMTAASCQGAHKLPRGNDNALATALQSGPVAMAFEIKGGFNYYKNGVLSINNCGGTPHHAMGLVGYTSQYWDIKNSWGSGWGDRGYVKFSRRINNMCGVSSWAAYPRLTKTGNDSDDTDDGGNDGGCSDKNSNCPGWKSYCDNSSYREYMSNNCKKTCGLCGGNGGGNCEDKEGDCASWASSGYCRGGYEDYMTENCPKSCNKCSDSQCGNGLTFCDGACKHEHFCGH